MERKYIRFKASELIEELEKIKNDQSDLISLIDEIGYRKKGANKLKETLIKAKRYNELIKNRSSKSTSKVTKKSIDKSKIKNVQKNNHDLKKNSNKNYFDKNNLENKISTLKAEAVEKKISSDFILEDKNEYSSLIETNYFLKIFGFEDLKILYLNDNLIIQYKKINSSISLSDIKEIKIKNGFFFNEIVIFYNDQSITLEKLTNFQTKLINLKISLLNKRKYFLIGLKDYQDSFKNNEYINQRKVDQWKKKYLKLYNLLNDSDNYQFIFDEIELSFLNKFKNIEQTIHELNNDYISSEKIINKAFFDELETNPLTEAQREAVINDNDASLIVAGAGTGKTSTVIGKIAYLIDKKGFKPTEILGLAYGNDAAQEIRDRVKDKIGVDVEIKTFHALGLKIVNEFEGKRVRIADIASNEKAKRALVAQLIVDLSKDEGFKSILVNFVTKHRYPAKYLEHFDSSVDYFKYLRKIEPQTLNGIPVKSFEELLIADWLTLNGIDYEYEYPYEHQTSSRKRNQYRPDFFLKEKGIYLEHFGINKDGSTAPFIDSKKYNEGIEWKRNTHKLNGTTLIESYSWERQEGIIFENLEKNLKNYGIKCRLNDQKIIDNIINIREVNQRLVNLIYEFLGVFKEGQYTFEELKDYSKLQPKNEKERFECFIELFKKVFDKYEEYLKKRQEIDFADLIVYAIKKISQSSNKTSFKRIIIDEYQDIARGRFRLLKELIKKNDDCRIMCVGDDWQAIYGFTGSDIKLTLNYGEIFGKYSRIDLDRSFRFSQPILDVSSKFIQKNNNQLKKNILSHPPVLEPAIEIYDKTEGKYFDLKSILDEIKKQLSSNKKWKILLLGRYKFKEPEELNLISSHYPNFSIEFKTIHSSKGLGADVVIVLGLETGKYGFPGYLEKDPIMNMVVTGEDDFLHAEERRVLYVAMTRAKQKLYLCTSQSSPSEFINELKQSEYGEIHYSGQAYDKNFIKCRSCSGELHLKYPNRLNGYSWQCQLSPYCDGKEKFCSVCKKLPGIGIDGQCLDENCRVN